MVGSIIRYGLVLLLVIAFVGLGTFAILSDNSIHGLTVRFYNVSWSCGSNPTSPILTLAFGSVVVYSSSSLTTSISKPVFSVSLNGITIGNVTGSDKSFGPGQSASYGISITAPTLNPHSQPLSLELGIAINAQVAAGLYSTSESASFSETVQFTGQPC